MRKSKTTFLSSSSQETKKIAEEIIQRSIEKKPNRKGALVVALSGELGAGKTNFTQGVASFLGVYRTVTSPTFVIMKRYDIAKENRQAASFRDVDTLFHFDCYRVYEEKELEELNWEEIISNPKHLVLVEWAERVKNILPDDAVWVTISSRGEEERELEAKF